MSILTLKQAALLPLALLCIACNPFEVQMPDQEGATRQRPAAAVDLPLADPASAQVSLGDSIPTSCDQGDHKGPHGKRPHKH